MNDIYVNRYISCQITSNLQSFFLQVTIQELQSIFKKLEGENKIKPSEIKAMLKAADRDRNGTINFNVSHLKFFKFSVNAHFLQEFTNLWQRLKNFGDHLSEDEKVIREEFDKLDVDGSGYISKQEMMATIESCEFLGSTKEAEAKRCLDDIDVNGDGKISYPEFLMVWKFKY